MNRYYVAVACLLLLTGCAILSTKPPALLSPFGISSPRERVVAAVPSGHIDYWSQVKPILDTRCVVCHACYDAPCQSKLTAPEAITRGANPSSPYDVERLIDAAPTRLFEDADSDAAWQDLGFHPVLNDYDQTTQANRIASPLYQLLLMKQAHPTPAQNQKLDEQAFSLELYRNSTCPTAQSMPQYAINHPNWGMPYALPSMTEQEQATLLQWLEQGATYTQRPALSVPIQAQINLWEHFFNTDSLKQQLVNRYLYEHLFLAHLYFDELDNRSFFKLVRSATPPGVPVKLIATRRPFDDPAVPRVYYRLVPEKETIVLKSHLPYALNPRRMSLWKTLFLEPQYRVTALPSYEESVSSNPFAVFKAIPSQSRYRFLLDEARFTIMNYIKGSVCRGPVALNVIRDQFWVFFVDPDTVDSHVMDDFLDKHVETLALPSINTHLSNIPLNWLRYSKKEKAWLQARNAFLETHMASADTQSDESIAKKGVDLSLIWDGNGVNPNAALTIFRHFDSATIEHGLLGQPPETAWVIDYPLLERIHYLLVAGYDVYGNVAHQLMTRLHMDFLRIEGETNFLQLLPSPTRQQLRARWYRDTHDEMVDYVNNSSFEHSFEPNIEFNTDSPKLELFDLLQHKLNPVLASRYNIAGIGSNSHNKNEAVMPVTLLSPKTLIQLQRLSLFTGAAVQQIPELSYIRIRRNPKVDASNEGDIQSDSEVYYLSLLRNNAQSNVSSLNKESDRILPKETTVTLLNGLLGAYPNVLLSLQEDQLPSFVDALLAMHSATDFEHIMDDYGIRRTHPEFWSLSDQLHRALLKQNPVEFGVIDYIRLQNR